MTATKCYKFRLRPTKEQEAVFVQWAGCVGLSGTMGSPGASSPTRTKAGASLQRARRRGRQTQERAGDRLPQRLPIPNPPADAPGLGHRLQGVLRQTRTVPKVQEPPENSALVPHPAERDGSSPRRQRAEDRHRQGDPPSGNARRSEIGDHRAESDGNWYVVFVALRRSPTLLRPAFILSALMSGWSLPSRRTKASRSSRPSCKSAFRHGQVVKAGRFFPSPKTCSDCATRKHLEISDRQWVCACCGVLHERDVDAAVNILREGLRLLQFPVGYGKL